MSTQHTTLRALSLPILSVGLVLALSACRSPVADLGDSLTEQDQGESKASIFDDKSTTAEGLVDMGWEDDEAMWVAFDGRAKSSQTGDLSELQEVSFTSARADSLVSTGDLDAFMALSDDFRTAADKAYSAGALASKPVTQDQYKLYEDRIVLHSITQIDVNDPTTMASLYPDFGAFFDPDAVLAKRAKDLYIPKETQAFIIDWMANPTGWAASQPEMISALATKDYREVYKVAFAGKGYFQREFSTTIYLDQSVGDEAFIDMGEVMDQLASLEGELPEHVAVPPDVATKGSRNDNRHEVFGGSIQFTPEYEDRWNFYVGFFRVTAGVAAHAGIRFPVDTTLNITPTEITGGAYDDEVPVVVEMETEGADYDADDYRFTGLEEMDGDELVLKGRAWMGCKLYVFGSNLIHFKNPPSANRFDGGDLAWDFVDVGEDFTAPLRNESASVQLSLDHTTTGFGIDYGVLDAGLDVGVQGEFMSMGHSAEIEFNQLMIDTADGYVAEPTMRVESTLPTVGRHGYIDASFGHDGVTDYKHSTDYGYTFSDPSYSVGALIIPGLRLSGNLGLQEYWGGSSLSVSTPWLTLGAIALVNHTWSSSKRGTTGSATAGTRVFEPEI